MPDQARQSHQLRALPNGDDGGGLLTVALALDRRESQAAEARYFSVLVKIAYEDAIAQICFSQFKKIDLRTAMQNCKPVS